jgi:hypothetical protein
MQREVQLGGLGPDYEGEHYRDKVPKLTFGFPGFYKVIFKLQKICGFLKIGR